MIIFFVGILVGVAFELLEYACSCPRKALDLILEQIDTNIIIGRDATDGFLELGVARREKHPVWVDVMRFVKKGPVHMI